MTSGSGYIVDGQTHYQRNKEVYLARLRTRREEIRQYLRAKKLASGCLDCGFDKHPDALDFDHIGEKTINPSRMIQRGWSNERIDRELSQCEVRCANCHRIKTAERLVSQAFSGDVPDFQSG
jgi:hypothetical protein